MAWFNFTHLPPKLGSLIIKNSYSQKEIILFQAAYWINDQDEKDGGYVNMFWKLLKIQDFVLTSSWPWCLSG